MIKYYFLFRRTWPIVNKDYKDTKQIEKIIIKYLNKSFQTYYILYFDKHQYNFLTFYWILGNHTDVIQDAKHNRRRKAWL